MFITTKTELTETYLPPATKLRQGNVFTPVCDSVHREGGLCLGGLCPGPGWISVWGGALSRQGSVGGVSVQEGLCPEGVSVQGGLCQGDPPAAVRLCTGGTHPTGMHSCFTCLYGIIVCDQESGTKIRLRANKSF